MAPLAPLAPRGLALLPAALLLSALLLPLALPDRVLMVRDLALFHLPLRQVMAGLLTSGELPEWNRFIHGGQPILSNPNYAAFYPPTWLALALPVHYAVSLLVLFHAALALAGSWLLLRRLGADAQAAGLGAMGFAGSSWFLSLTSTFTSFCGMAWFPWVLAAGQSAFAAPRGRWSGPALLAACALALQLLAGEPVPVLMAGTALACFAVWGPERLRRSVPRLLAVAVLASSLAAVQLVPTLHRVAGTARAAGLSAADATRWSMPPARLVDFVLPRFWGDSMRDEEGLWFGWGLHDRDFPFVVSLYSGLLLTVLAAAALLRWRIPYRGAWAWTTVAGLLLALGRHNPLWEPLRRAVPLLAIVRFPERFALLTAAVVPLAGALGWQHLIEARQRGEHRTLWPAAAMAGLVAAVAAGLASALAWQPELGEGFIRRHSGQPPSPRTLVLALDFLRREALVALLLAAAVTLLLAGLGSRRLSPRAAGLAAMALLAGDLWWYGRGLEPTLPAGSILTPPPAVAAVRGAGGRLFSAASADQRPELGLRQGPPGFQQLWARQQRLDPYVGTLWGIEYALHADYDLMLTRWGRHGLSLLEVAWPQRDPVDRLLGAWDVGALVLRRDPRELVGELRRTHRPPLPYRVVPEPQRLPRFRFVRSLSDAENEAAASAALSGLDLASSDLCIGASVPAGDYSEAAVLAATQAQRVNVRYRAVGRAFLVAAITYDEGWDGTLEDGSAVPLCPTSLGQIGAALPAGEHVLSLTYRDPWVRVGAGISAITVLGAALVALRRRRTESHPGEDDPAGTPSDDQGKPAPGSGSVKMARHRPR